ncbi:MAG: ImmA/IrrE family metallo-endopeptidase [Pseudomonadota bacterium]|nr:ImmA/IrrE family metallo-endopeptidase [Pseudomonadota bacterium]
MSTHWEKLSGDTGVFAFKLLFSPDPDGGDAIDPVESLSWGGFQLWVEGRNLCAHLEEGERVDSVHWYLLPMLEWLASNWNPLLHEERPPVRNKADSAWECLQLTRFPPPAFEERFDEATTWEENWHSWWSRHSIRASREGGLFPDIVLRRWRDRIEVSWGGIGGQGAPEHFRFLESARGTARLPPAVVAEALHDVLRQGAQTLFDLASDSPRIKALRARVANLRSARRNEDQRLMWLAGLGTDESSVRQGWRRLKGYLRAFDADQRASLLEAQAGDLVIEGSCQAAMMFGSVAPDIRKGDALVLARYMVGLYDPEGDPGPLRDVVRYEPLSRSAGPSWEQGYALAEDLLGRFADRIVGESGVDIESLTRLLGVTVEEGKILDASIRGVSLAGPRHRAGILINTAHGANGYPSGRRFTLAHELCHILFDRAIGRKIAVASGPWAPRDVERRANAFAAMLLMPRTLVKKALAGLTTDLETKEGVAQVANRLGASFSATLRHLNNLGFLDDYTRQRIRYETVEASLQVED